jgi:predicted Zn-dependent protease
MDPQPSPELELDQPSGLRAWALGVRRWFAVWASSLPAVLAAVLVFGLAVASARLQPHEIAHTYEHSARRASAARDYNTARVCYERLARLPHASLEAKYRVLLSYEAMGESAQAAPLWSILAPPDQPGFAPAQVRRARAVLGTSDVRQIPRALALAEQHLKQALRTEPESAEANALLGEILVKTGRVNQAIPLLRVAARGRPELGLNVAAACRAAGREKEAREYAAEEERAAAQRLAAAPDDYLTRLSYANAVAFLGDHAKAAAVLRHGFERTGDARYGPASAALHADWYDTLTKEPSADPARTRAVLAEGLRWDPNSVPLLIRFEKVLRAGGAEADEARRALNELLASGRAGGEVHFVLGTDAWLRGDSATARAHFEAAAKHDPRGGVVANNLAWLMAHEPKPDLDRALSLANMALDRAPDLPQFRGTRGVILAKLGRWKEALPELEAALLASPDDAELHQYLADACEHQGLAELAAAHRKRSGGAGPPKR